MTRGRAAKWLPEVDGPGDAPGVSRFDLICGPDVRETSDHLVRRWAEDRALPGRATERLCLVASAAVGHGLMYRPRAVTLAVSWADLDRVQVDLRWHGCAGVASEGVSAHQLDSTVAILDALADSWGFGDGTRKTQWIVVDASA
jgi:hypothetical protein